MVITQQPDALSLSGNLKKFVISSASPVSFKLMDGGTVLLDEVYEPGSLGSVSVDVRQLVERRLSYSLSGSNFYAQPNLAKLFSATIDGQSVSFRVVRSGVQNLADTPANWLRSNFLTWQPTAMEVSYYSPSWLTYFAAQSCTIKLKAYFDDGTTQTITLGSCSANQAHTANVQYAVVAGLLDQKYPTHYDVWVDGSGSPLTYTQRYFYGLPKSELEQWVLFENSLGGLDTLRASGATSFSGEHSFSHSVIDGTSTEFDIDTQRIYTQHTGALDEYQRLWLKDLFPAHRKYVHHNGAIRPIVLTETDAQFTNADFASGFSFSFRFADDSRGLLNLIRNEGAIPDAITLPNIQAPNFLIPPRLSELPRVQLAEGVILPAFDPHSDSPKITTVGALIAAAVAEALGAIPGGDGTPGGGGQLVNIIKEHSLSAGTDNDVFSSNRTRKEINDAIQAFADSIDDYLGNLDEKYLSKINPDTAAAVITFLQGLNTKQLKSIIFAPGLLGEGFQIDEFGNATFDSITARKYLSVPEIRFNRTTVYTGIRWDTFGGGKIKDVIIDYDEDGNQLQSGTIELELEDGEPGAVALDDFAMGIFHNFGGANDSTTEDQQNGNFRFKGFNTSYFRVTEILESDNSRFRYALRGISENWTQQHHPSQFMNFACYANPTNKDRQASNYTTVHYSIRLANMTTWEYGADNIYRISGRLDGFQVGDTILQGYGTAEGNGYFWGTLQQVYNNPVYMEIDNNGDGFLALGETMTITCRVMQGWEDITDTVETWTVTRETGNQVEDTAWNITHQNFNGVLQLTHTKQQTDLGSGLTTLFVFTAKAGEITASFHLTI